MVDTLGIDSPPNRGNLKMPQPLAALRRYVTAVRSWLRGEGPPTHLPQRPAVHPVPLYMATLGSRAVELAGELGDGIMPVMWPAARVKKSKMWAARGRTKAPDLGPVDVTLGLPTFIGDDLAAMRTLARQNLALYTGLPFFQRMFRQSGFTVEAAQMKQGAGSASLSDRLLDAICLIGPAARCREQLAGFRDAGVDLAILYPPIGVGGSRAVIQAFQR